MRERRRPRWLGDYEVRYTTNDAALFEFNSLDVESMHSDAWYPHSSAIVRSVLRKSGRVETLEEPIMIIHADVIKKVCESGGLSAALAHLTKLSEVLGTARVMPFEDFMKLVKARKNVCFNAPADFNSIARACKLLGTDGPDPKDFMDLRDLVVQHNDSFMAYFPEGKQIPAPGKYASLQELVRFIRDDLKFVQKHSGPEDVLLNNELLEFIVRTLSCKPPSCAPAS